MPRTFFGKIIGLLMCWSLAWGTLAQAGDILRGGTPGTRRNSPERANVGQEAAARAKAKAEDRLSRTTQAIQAVQAMQTAARGLAPNSSGLPLPPVPNGLGPGGLDLQGAPTGALMPQQSGNKVTIRQTASQAILNWKTFNVGRNTSLYFDQRAGGNDSGKWIAFNKVTDPTGSPSQILGSIKAEGQVYIINQNGILFGAGSQVNVRALVASALPINDNLINRGLLNNPDAQFLFSAIALPAGTKGPTPAFTPPASTLPDGSFGNVVVERGAVLTASTTAEKVGGRITLVGANVENRGIISTPDGQTILAAGLQVGFAAHASNDPSLRGLDVYVGSVTYPAALNLPQAGIATNLGLIDVPRANATIAGRQVRQLGAIDSSTTTAVNGRIDLRADYGATSNTSFDPLNSSLGPVFNLRDSGLVEIGAGSVMRILPELGSTETVPGIQLSLPSQVNIMGRAIRFGADSILLAPGANVTVHAGNWLATGANQPTQRRFTGGQIYFEPGALIDVAGTVGILAPLAQNILTLQLRGAELANSPVQRNGLLRGPFLTIDLRRSGVWNGFAWIGTPLGDVSGFAALIQRTVGELTVAGGTVSLTAGESVIMQPGSEIDVSGGWLRYEGGMVQTTRLKRGNQLVDIHDATPDLIYDGIYEGTTTITHPKWGISKTYALPLSPLGARYEQSYIHGANAGAISITAPSMALDGTLTGHAVQGPRQSNSATASFAKRGTLNLAFQSAESLAPFWAFSPTPPRIVFAANTGLGPAEPFAMAADGAPVPLRADRKASLILSPDLFTEHGFGHLTVDNSDGSISVPEGAALNIPLLGSLTLLAANLDIGGAIIAPGGNLDFSVFNFSPFSLAKLKANINTAVTPPPDPERGIFTLGPEAFLSTAGLVTDYRRDAAADPNLPPVIDGGSISIKAYTADLAPGGVIDVSGGVRISETGKRRFGVGGNIVINAGNDPGLAWLLGGKLRLGAQLRGYSGIRGGSLAIQAPVILIGGSPSALPGFEHLAEPTEDGLGELLHLTPEFFTRGGFTSYTLNGLGKPIDPALGEFVPAITIAPGTVIRPTAENWLAHTAWDSVTLRPFLKPVGLRAPVSLAFGSSTLQDTFAQPSINVLRGDIVMGAGAVIETDPGAGVSFRGSTVAILGSVIAPGGIITVSGANAFPAYMPSAPLPEFNQALPTVHLGPQSLLSTAGRVVLIPDPYGRRIGAVLPGGIISVSGNIVAEAGAVLDVSGASGILDLPPASLLQNLARMAEAGYRPVPLNSGLNAPLYNLATVPTRVDSDAGILILQGGQELFTDATLRGFAGGPSALGGTLVIASGRFVDPNDPTDAATPLDINLIVRQSGRNIPSGFYPADGTAIGHAVPVANGDPIRGLGHFSVESFLEGGFDILKLSGIGGSTTGGVGFSGPVSISARRALIVSDGGVIYADSSVFLEAPYVALGTPFKDPALPGSETNELSFPGPFYFPPIFGPGSLTVRASLIDIGNLSLQNIGRAAFLADGGDIRGNGVLNVAGEIFMRAGQIYPTTAGVFTIVAYDPNIVVAASSNASTQVTLASPILPPGFGVGSPLLGSTVAAINGADVTLAANANATITANTPVTFAPGTGSVTIAGSGNRPLPLSAGGILSIYASNITQGGTLRAPLGTINLGWDGIGASPVDYLTGAGLVAGRSVPVTQKLILAGGSVTSVSAIDPLTGLGVLIPYGFNANGTAWIDPRGIDITGGGLPGKAVNLFALDLDARAGSVIDVRGGGDLYAYTWVTGNAGTHDILGAPRAAWNANTSYNAGQLVSYGGSTWSARRASQGVTPTVSLDWTLLPETFAVLPGYQANFAPYAPFNTSNDALNLAISDPGYVNAGLAVGDRVYLGPGSGLPAGIYTLLPARYALLPGAVLVTPQPGAAREPLLTPEGATIVSGYRFNDLYSGQSAPAQATRFEVAPASVFRARAQYDDFLAGSYLKDMAVELGLDVPRLPGDAGRVVLAGLNALRIDGTILARSTVGGYGGEIDISTAADIIITGQGGNAAPGTVVLSAAKLSSFGAESILIGGLRRTTPDGTLITVRTSNIMVDNAGTPLTAPEIILVARDLLTLAPGAQIIQSGLTRGSDLNAPLPLLIGDSAVPGSGNGLLLRVSDIQVPVIRSGVSSQAAQAALAVPPTLAIGAGAGISAGALLLDSTYGTTLDPTARLNAGNLALNSGQISLAFENPGAVPAIPGLMLSGPVLEGLQAVRTLSLLSYSSIDLYGTGIFDAAGTLAFHAAQIRGFNNGGGLLTFTASRILLDNIAGSTALDVMPGLSGGLVLDAGTILLGAGQVRLDHFATVELDAAGGLLATRTGGLIIPGALTINAPVITAARAVNYAITAAGALDYLAPEGATGRRVRGGIGAALSLTGASLSVNSHILLPSGVLDLRATAGDLLVGNLSEARLDLGGTQREFYDLVRYTDGGQIRLAADNGSVTLGTESEVNVAARPGGGDGGAVSISAANGSFTLAGTLDGRGGAGGWGGSFFLDVNSLPGTSALDPVLNDASFDLLRSIRVRSGDVAVDGLATAQTYLLSADQGSITVTDAGNIDASGETGGKVSLQAFGNVTLESGARISVAGQDFNSAGQGGAIFLEAGSQRNGAAGPGFVDIQAGSTLDLSVASKVAGDATTPGTSAYNGQFSGKLHIRAPQNTAGTDLQVGAIDGTIVDPSSIVIEGYRLYDLTDFGGTITSAVQTSIFNDGVRFLGTAGATTASYTAMMNRLLENNAGLPPVTVLAPGAEIINSAAAAALNYSLNAIGSAITIPAGGSIYFPDGTAGGSTIRSNVAGTITSASGVVTPLAANTNTVIPPGSSVTLNNAGNLTYASGSGPINIDLAPGSTYTTTTMAGVVGTISARGSTVTLNAANTSSIALAANTSVTFPNGTPGNSRITSTVAGIITSATGEQTPLAANTATAIPAGSQVTLAAAGSITSTNVSGGVIPVVLASGSFTSTGPIAATPPTGDLTLGASNSAPASDWNLATYRFGAKSAPGVLTLRAAGNLIFFNTLSDGFTSSAYTAVLLAQNPLLPINTQSWSYRLAAGADLAAADYHRVAPISALAANAGSLQLGKLITTNNGIPVATGGLNAQTSSVVPARFQVIRTGSGDIDISAGRDVQLLNPFASVYTAGTQTSDPTLGGNFQVPPSVNIGNQGTLGAVQQNPTYQAQYSLGGGNVTISAGQDIKHQTQRGGVLVADSQKQVPNNWLYRRGIVDPETGEFALTRDGEIGSTTWWIDFSNFFQGVGALGGGNVTLIAGNDISNVDAVAPTNARMTYQTDTGDRQVASQTLLELGGGDVTVRAGRNIDAGIYYVERGRGTLIAGNSIITNSTRTVNDATPPAGTPTDLQWLPTTLFLGKGGFDVSAAGDVLLGPTVNPFLLPVGLNNSFWNKTYFSTYAPDSYVNVTSLGGNITLRQNVTPFTTGGATTLASDEPILLSWMRTVHLLTPAPQSLSFSQPWLRLAETTLQPFNTVYSLLPGTLRATAFSGDINPVGRLNLSPSPTGTIELAAAGAINGLQPSGVVRLANVTHTAWTSAKINLSDADPNALPGAHSPYAYRNVVGTGAIGNRETLLDFLLFIDNMFRESGASTGAQSFIQTQQALHGTGLLHANDPEPARLYAGSGNISGLTFFSSKFAKVVAGADISDIALYIQNTRPSDISIVSSGRDIIAYNANSLLRVAAQSAGNVLNSGEGPLAGDLQISGPGTLAVFAGRNLDLGVGENNPDGTGVGLTSIGNARNPNLPFAGADIIAAAGIGPIYSLAESGLDFEGFLNEVLDGPDGERLVAEVIRANPALFSSLGTGSLESLDEELRAKLALDIFYLVLRDAGRNHNVIGSPGFGNYEAGFAAIAALFPNGQSGGSINTRTRDIRTRSGGNISLLAPSGGLSLATTTLASSLAPPGIITEAGGHISIFTDGDVDIGISRIFTLRGGNEIIWSSNGNIAAGSSAKTVQSAPPTRVLIDPQTADLKVDLAGLATGGGIGVLATVEGVEPGSVDLIAPNGTVDAGDAGIRATGDLNIAAVQVLNADNISVAGNSVGVPVAPPVAAPNIAGLTAAASTAGAATSAMEEVAQQALNQGAEEELTPSLISVDVLGYGGEEDEEEEEKNN